MRRERRRSHESFRSTLAKVTKRIDEKQQFNVSWRDWIFEKPQTSLIRIDGLWAAGSWARGAPTCGDLDLIMQVTSVEGPLPPGGAISRTVLHAPADVRLYIGTPGKNSSGAEFPESVLIWSPEHPDFKQHLASVLINESAGRFARKTDVIPLRTEQLDSDLESLEKLADRQSNGEIRWEWIDDSSLVQLRVDRWSRNAFDFLSSARLQLGQKTFSLLPKTVDYLERQNTVGEWRTDFHDKTTPRKGAIEIRLGRPHTSTLALDEMGCGTLLLVPHVTRRGPNGIWRIERGPNHPLERRFEKFSAYFLEVDSRPFAETIHQDWRPSLQSLTLFARKDQANEAAEAMGRKSYGSTRVAVARNVDLLRLIAEHDIVKIGRAKIAVSIDARVSRYRAQKGSAEKIEAALKRSARV